MIRKFLIASVCFFFGLLAFSQTSPILSYHCDECNYPIDQIALSHHGDYIAIGGHNPKLIDSFTGVVVREFGELPGVARTTLISFSPNDNFLLVGYHFFQANLYRVEDGTLLHTFTTFTKELHDSTKVLGGVEASDFSEDSSLLAIGDPNGGVHIFDLDDYREIARHQFAHYLNEIKFSSLSFPRDLSIADHFDQFLDEMSYAEPESRILASGFAGFDSVIWDYRNDETTIIASGQIKSEFGDWFYVRKNGPDALVNFSENIIRYIDISDDNLDIQDVTAEGDLLLTASLAFEDGSVILPRSIVGVESNTTLREYPFSKQSGKDQPDSPDTLVRFFPDSERILSVNNKTIYIYDISDLTTAIKPANVYKN
ncbi:MAG: hypothetical protein GC154_20120 [bacterium]|nr:hypothetical protein [bacterium]